MVNPDQRRAQWLNQKLRDELDRLLAERHQSLTD